MYSAFDYDVISGIAPDAYGAVQTFAVVSRILEISILDQAATFQLQKSDGTLGDEITYDPSQQAFPYQVPFKCTGFRIRNTAAGVTARYQFISWL